MATVNKKSRIGKIAIPSKPHKYTGRTTPLPPRINNKTGSVNNAFPATPGSTITLTESTEEPSKSWNTYNMRWFDFEGCTQISSSILLALKNGFSDCSKPAPSVVLMPDRDSIADLLLSIAKAVEMESNKESSYYSWKSMSLQDIEDPVALFDSISTKFDRYVINFDKMILQRNETIYLMFETNILGEPIMLQIRNASGHVHDEITTLFRRISSYEISGECHGSLVIPYGAHKQYLEMIHRENLLDQG